MYSNTFRNPKNLEDSLRFFSRMREKDIDNIRAWYLSKPAVWTIEEMNFLTRLNKALSHVNYEFRWPIIEPSVDSGKIYYEMNAPVNKWFSYYDWRNMAESFAPDYNSGVGTLYELYIVYAHRIVQGHWSLQYVCDDSTAEGNYLDSPDSFGVGCENAGKRKIGGYFDGIGNTTKLVEHNMECFCCGGDFNSYGRLKPVAHFEKKDNFILPIKNATAVVILRR